MKKLILILSISFIFFLISCNGQEELISTPSIIGLKIRDAEKIAEDKGLLVKVTKSDFSKIFQLTILFLRIHHLMFL